MQMQFSELARSDIHWWAEKSWFYVKTISHGNPWKGGVYTVMVWSLHEADG